MLSKRRLIVPALSSAARMPLPFVTMAWATVSNSCFDINLFLPCFDPSTRSPALAGALAQDSAPRAYPWGSTRVFLHRALPVASGCKLKRLSSPRGSVNNRSAVKQHEPSIDSLVDQRREPADRRLSHPRYPCRGVRRGADRVGRDRSCECNPGIGTQDFNLAPQPAYLRPFLSRHQRLHAPVDGRSRARLFRRRVLVRVLWRHRPESDQHGVKKSFVELLTGQPRCFAPVARVIKSFRWIERRVVNSHLLPQLDDGF